MPNEPKVRTRTRTRRGGDIVKTKTVTKGDGMKRVEKTKTAKGPFGTSSSRSVYEGGPMGKSRSSSYMYKSNEGDSYGFNLEKTKKGGVKTVRSSDIDTYKVPAGSTIVGRKKYDIPEYTSTDKTSMSKTKSKGNKSKMVKTTTGAEYDIRGKIIPERTTYNKKGLNKQVGKAAGKVAGKVGPQEIMQKYVTTIDTKTGKKTTNPVGKARKMKGKTISEKEFNK